MDYNEAIRLKPNLAEAYGNRGKLKMYLGSIEDAKTDFQIALELAGRQTKENLKVDVEKRAQELKRTE